MDLFACEAGQKARGDLPRAPQFHVPAPASPSRRQRNASRIEFFGQEFRRRKTYFLTPRETKSGPSG
jgi:hypothetical protein